MGRALFVGQCPSCERWQMFRTENIQSYVLECFHCTHTVKVKDNRDGGTRIRLRQGFDNAEHASRAVQSFNAEVGDEERGGFHVYNRRDHPLS